MVRLSPREFRLLKYARKHGADLSRQALSDVAMLTPESLSSLLTRLQRRGLIYIKRGRHRRIEKIDPTFLFVRGIKGGFRVKNKTR